MSDEVNEQAGAVEGATSEPTGEESSEYTEALMGDNQVTGESAEAEVEPEQQSQEGESQEAEATADDPDLEIELGGKLFKGKQSELMERLEQWEQFKEKQKSLNRDYTQKTQQLAEVRKSFETAFGQMPSNDELGLLGKVYQSYFKNPNAQAAIDAILSGTIDNYQPNGNGRTPQGQNVPPETQALLNEINSLKRSHQELLSNMEQQRQASSTQEAQRTWAKWEASKKEAGVEISEEINNQMAPFIGPLSNAHPDWDDMRILDEAYRHATIDSIEKATTQKVLKKADQARRVVPKISPNVPVKSEKDMEYSELIQNG